MSTAAAIWSVARGRSSSRGVGASTCYFLPLNMSIWSSSMYSEQPIRIKIFTSFTFVNSINSYRLFRIHGRLPSLRTGPIPDPIPYGQQELSTSAQTYSSNTGSMRGRSMQSRGAEGEVGRWVDTHNVSKSAQSVQTSKHPEPAAFRLTSRVDVLPNNQAHLGLEEFPVNRIRDERHDIACKGESTITEC